MAISTVRGNSQVALGVILSLQMTNVWHLVRSALNVAKRITSQREMEVTNHDAFNVIKCL